VWVFRVGIPGALAIEFKIQGLPFKEQQLIEIMYKGKCMEKRYQPDFICFDDIIVEIKALSKLTGNEGAQLINYLKAVRLEKGLLINFGSKSLEYKRLIHTHNPQIPQI
jgi:GxxExxY protein